jgi:hypothetical protein
MKRYLKNIAAGVSMLLTLVSCEDFLTKVPTGSLSSGTMFTTAETAESAVVGAYNSLRYGHVAQWATNLDCFTEIFDPNASRVGTSYMHLTGAATTGDGIYNSFWQNYYEGIYRANDVINNFHLVPDMTEEAKAKRIAEAKFLRAWWYYRLNCLYGGVPVFLENYAPEYYFTVGRTDKAGVWQVIINDLNDCIACESLPDKYEQGGSDWGRVTKGAAYALRGKVWLWLEEWEKAENDFKKVGECGYGLYTNGTYAELFTEANEKCNEMVFSVQMAEESGYGQAYSYNYGNHCTAGTGQNAYNLNARFADSFENVDGSPFNWDDVIPGYSSVDPAKRRAYFLRDNLSSSERTNQADLGADMSLYLQSGNEARIKAAYENRDPRLAALAITPYSEYVGGVSGVELTYVYRFPFDSKNEPVLDLETAAPTNLSYPLRKFVSVGVEYTHVTYNPLDIPLIRYADVLLGLAEAHNEQNEFDEALACVNKIRARAGVAELNSVDYKGAAVSSQEELRERIRMERKWELAGEQVLYFDELRWGTWKDDKFGNDNGITHAWGGMIQKYNLGGDYYELWPVPRSEIEKNNELEQNDGWIN